MKRFALLTVLMFCCAIANAEEQNKAFINFGGFVGSSFASSEQSKAYSHNTLPNNNSTLQSIQRQNLYDGSQSRTNSRFDITGGIKLANGTTIGATIVMNSLVSSNDDDSGHYANQNFIFITSKYGKSEIGVAPTTAATMRIDATLIGRGSGGIGGDWWRFVNFPTFNTAGLSADSANELAAGYMPIFLLQPMLPNEAGFTTGATSSLFIYNGTDQSNPQLINGKYDAMYYNRQQPRFGYNLNNVINYYTKRINGVQLGVSYAPDTGNAGTMTGYDSAYLKNGAGSKIGIGGSTSRSSGDVRNYISLGLNYKEQFGNLGVALSGTYEQGQAENLGNPYGVNGGCGVFGGDCVNGFKGRRDLSAWAIGGKLTYAGLSLAGSYGSWGKSLQPNKNNAKDSSGSYLFPWLVPLNKDGTEASDYQDTNFGNIGIAYGFGPINFSITQLRTNYAGNVMNATSFGTDLRVGSGKFRGFVPYIEYTNFSMQGKTIYLQSLGQAFTPLENKGHVFMTGVRVIF